MPRTNVRDPASPDEVKDLLGDVGDLVTEQILETSASPSEISEALRSLEAEDLADREVDFAPTSPRVMEVRAVLMQMAEEDEGEEGFLFPYDDVHESR